MKKIIIFTVGGSPDPIISTIKNDNFDFFYFICTKTASPQSSSDRIVDGEPLKNDEKIIVKDTNIPQDRYKKIILEQDTIDDINLIYERLEKDLLSDIKNRFSDENVEIIANYTGGTKSMSAALVLIAIYQKKWNIQVNSGQRTNLIKIESDDFPTYINVSQLNYSREKIHFDDLLKKFYYDVIVEKVESLLKEKSLLTETRNELLLLRNIFTSFLFWDKFDHENSYTKMENISKSLDKNSDVKKIIVKYILCLKKITEKISTNGYYKVIDLILNAERRSIQERFDDAIARYYRAVELLAQIRLMKNYNIDPSNIDCNDVVARYTNPKFVELIKELSKNSEAGKNRIKIGLVSDYEVLAALDDPLGIFYLSKKKYLLNALEKRNNSILAHGNTPIFKDDFIEIEKIFKEFIYEGLESIKAGIKDSDILQFPQSLTELGFSVN